MASLTTLSPHSRIRHRAATLALAATVTLTGFKIIVGLVSGSAAVFSEGLHSFLDLVSAAISFFTVREAGKPADDDHPFGHGKIETLSSLFESVLLVCAAGLMILDGAMHLRKPEPLEYQGLAVGAIVFSMAVSYFMYRHNLRAAESVESSALEVNALHFLADVVASVAVIAALVVVHYTGWLWVDALMAFAVAAYIVAVSTKRVTRAMKELTDTQLPPQEIAEIRAIIGTFQGRGLEKMVEAHGLRTRRSGATRHIDFHLNCCGMMTVDESHAVCDRIEDRIAARFPDASVNIHVEPCERESRGCGADCPIYSERKNSA